MYASRKENQEKQKLKVKAELKAKEEAEKHIPQVPTALFFQYNTQLGPPYHVLVDTNFINFSIKNKVFWIFVHLIRITASDL